MRHGGQEVGLVVDHGNQPLLHRVERLRRLAHFFRPIQCQGRLFEVTAQPARSIGQAMQRAQAQAHGNQAHQQHGDNTQRIHPQQVIADQHPGRLAAPALQFLARNGQPVPIGQRQRELDMRLGRAQAEQAAPDDRLAQFVGELHVHQAHVLGTPQFVLQGLLQQQLHPPVPAALVMLLRRQAFDAAKLVVGWRLQCTAVAVDLGNQGGAACSNQSHGHL